MTDPDAAHWIVEADPDGRAVGYVILSGLESPHRNIEFKRVALAERGAGLGREALRLVKAFVFERLGAHRLWLDVMDHNERAARLYRSEGFVVEGVQRECVKRDDRYVSLIVMSMLESEYRAARASGSRCAPGGADGG